jgi:hypothetical protein
MYSEVLYSSQNKYICPLHFFQLVEITSKHFGIKEARHDLLFQKDYSSVLSQFFSSHASDMPSLELKKQPSLFKPSVLIGVSSRQWLVAVPSAT